MIIWCGAMEFRIPRWSVINDVIAGLKGLDGKWLYRNVIPERALVAVKSLVISFSINWLQLHHHHD